LRGEAGDRGGMGGGVSAGKRPGDDDAAPGGTGGPGGTGRLRGSGGLSGSGGLRGMGVPP
jgi:hypothetical protein